MFQRGVLASLVAAGQRSTDFPNFLKTSLAVRGSVKAFGRHPIRIRSFHCSCIMSNYQQDEAERYVFPPPPAASLPVIHRDTSTVANVTSVTSPSLLFPIHRVYCVGKNYEDHVKEMGGDVHRSKPVFFTKPSDGVVLAEAEGMQQSKGTVGKATAIRYPPNTNNLHYECELVVTIGKSSEDAARSSNEEPPNRIIPVGNAAEYIFGFAVGIDLTRRDLQKDAKDRRGPWDVAKQFDQCAPMGSITKMSLAELQEMSAALHMELQVNGVVRQSTKPLEDMIWSIPEIISELSKSYTLQPGDLIMTGTPAGVGPVEKGDEIIGRVFHKSGDDVEKDTVIPVNMALV